MMMINNLYAATVKQITQLSQQGAPKKTGHTDVGLDLARACMCQCVCQHPSLLNAQSRAEIVLRLILP